MTDDEREAKRLRHEAGRRACELLGFGPGCRDGGCVLFGPGTKVNAMHTNSMCHCIEDGPDGRRRRPHETRAIRAAIKAALAVLLAEVTTESVPKLPRAAQAMAGEVELLSPPPDARAARARRVAMTQPKEPRGRPHPDPDTRPLRSLSGGDTIGSCELAELEDLFPDMAPSISAERVRRLKAKARSKRRQP